MAEKTVSDKEKAFSKMQFMQSEKFANRKDLVGALLEDGKEYTIAQVETIIKNYLKGRVK